MSEHARIKRSFSGGSFRLLGNLIFVATGKVIVSVAILSLFAQKSERTSVHTVYESLIAIEDPLESLWGDSSLVVLEFCGGGWGEF